MKKPEKSEPKAQVKIKIKGDAAKVTNALKSLAKKK
jgi:hypothetical protein